MNNLNDIGDKKCVLIILVGPPGSGKTTWGKDFANKNNMTYVSTDEIRGEIGKGEADQSVSAAAFGVAKQRVSQALSQGKHTMIDATSVNKKARKDWINMGRGHGAYVISVAFEVSTDELYRRDAQRPRHVGKEIIDRFVGKYQRPDTTEVDKVIIK
jgi:protein phosphatase